MKTKLIKLSELHYIIVDDSEIKEGKWLFDKQFGISKARWNTYEPEPKTQWAITHSTPIGGLSAMLEVGVRELSLSDIEEAINGYNVEKMAEIDWINKEYGFEEGYNPKRCVDGVIQKPKFINGYIKGFNAHKELVKDKLFTIDDIKIFYKHVKTHTFDEAISLILPKTEWDIEFDKQGKIKLL